MRKALVDLTSIFLILMPAIVAIIGMYFAFQELGKVASEVGQIAAQKVIIVKPEANDCKVAVIGQK